MDVEITTQPELRAVAVRHVGPYNRIGEAFGRLGEIAGRAGILGPSTPMIGIYHDDPRTTPAEKLRSDAAVVVPQDAKVPQGLTELTVPAGRYARVTHVGPYEKLPEAWERLMGEWLPQSGHRSGDGVAYEVYRNNPMNAKPADLITEIYVPVQE
jgi:AraC family transcriptional regulator